LDSIAIQIFFYIISYRTRNAFFKIFILWVVQTEMHLKKI